MAKKEKQKKVKVSKEKKQKKVKKSKKSKSQRMISLRFKLVTVITSIIVLSLLGVGIGTSLTASTLLEDNFKANTQELVDQTARSTQLYFEKYESLMNLLAADENIKKATTNSMFKDRLYEFMGSIFHADDNILKIYWVSAIRGQEGLPEGWADESVEYRDSSWYKAAVNSEDMVWSEPIDSADGMYITVSKAVYNDDRTDLYGVASLDISLNVITEMLNNIQIGEAGFPSLITDKFVIVTHPSAEFIGQALPVPEIQSLIESGKRESVNYKMNENGKNESKFAVYSTLEGTGFHVIATMYQSEIVEQTNIILVFIVGITIAAILIAVIIAFIFARSISKGTNTLLDGMKRVQGGDLTTTVDVKSRDEIGAVGKYFTESIQSIAGLMVNVRTVSDELAESAQNLAATAEETSASSDEVSRTVEEIAQGASDQAKDAEDGAVLARNLSDKFVDLSANTEILLNSTQSVIKANLDGVDAIKSLRDKTTLSDQANDEIELVINELDSKTQSISTILDAISSIAEQTNLLALNASIEAARAGEHGRGFAVVADEIRKLAEQSSTSAEEIRDIVVNIQTDSKKTVSSMADLKIIANEQSQAVDQVDKTFITISSSVDKITSNIDNISESVNLLESDKNEIVSSIDNISAVSEETAAAAEEVTASMDQQNMAIEEVARSAELLNEISTNLKVELNKFKLD